MNEDFPKSYDELLDKLNREGSISVEFEEMNKQRLKASFDRINKMNLLLARRNRFLGSVIYFIYSMWVGLIDVVFTPKDKGFEYAHLVYSVAWSKISKFHGESVAGGRARVIFYART